MRHGLLKFAGILLAVLLTAGPALADGHGRHGSEDDDHDLARELYEHGEIKPLEQVLAAVAAHVPGDVVAVDLIQDKDDHWIYVVQVITADGKRVVVDVNAVDATIVNQPDGGST